MDYRQFVAILKEAGWTPSNFRRSELLASLSKEEFEALNQSIPKAIEAMDKASDREARRIMRARK